MIEIGCIVPNDTVADHEWAGLTPDCPATHIPMVIGKSAVDDYGIAVVIIYRPTMSGCGVEIKETVY